MRLAIALLAALTAAPALAASAPAAPDMSNIQPGPRTEDGYMLPRAYSDAIDLSIDTVHGEGPAKGIDQCAVTGRVLSVHRGLHYRAGEIAVINVPCSAPHLSPLQLSIFGGFTVDRDWLVTLRTASIQLDASGKVVSFTSDRGLMRVY
ncbi:MAG TPA: hypothetical protein VG407_01250 [Caulobacteraceae bacterium]|jgi:hypothetical protein|nr:hypothetical protein [Caulobacteraceae bacterium]